MKFRWHKSGRIENVIKVSEDGLWITFEDKTWTCLVNGELINE